MGDKKERALTVRFTEEEWTLLQGLADTDGRSVGQVVRDFLGFFVRVRSLMNEHRKKPRDRKAGQDDLFPWGTFEEVLTEFEKMQRTADAVPPDALAKRIAQDVTGELAELIKKQFEELQASQVKLKGK